MKSSSTVHILLYETFVCGVYFEISFMIVQHVGNLVGFNRISVIVAGLNFVFKRTVGECSEHLSGIESSVTVCEIGLVTLRQGYTNLPKT